MNSLLLTFGKVVLLLLVESLLLYFLSIDKNYKICVINTWNFMYMWPDLRKHASFTHPIFQLKWLINSLWMTDSCETFRDCRTTIPLSSLKVSNLYTIACGFYGSPNEQNRMCEQGTFSQIRSHIYCYCSYSRN